MKKKLKRKLAILLSAVIVWTAVGMWLPGGTYEVKASVFSVNSASGIMNAFNSCTEDSVNFVELEGNIVLSNADLNSGSVFQLTAGNLEMDLRGHMIDASACTNSGTIFFNSGGSLTITDSVGGGRIISPPDGVVVRSEWGTLNISGGSFENAAQCLSIQNTTVNITGGSFVTNKGGKTDVALLVTGDNSIVKISDGNFESAYGTIFVQNTVEKESSLIIEGGTFTVDENGSFGYACYVGGACNLDISGGTFNLNAAQGSSLMIGTNVTDAMVSLSGGTFNGRIARMIAADTDWNYTTYYGDRISTSGVIADGYVLTDNTFHDSNGQPTVFTADKVAVVPGHLINYNTRRTTLEKYDDSEIMETVKADEYSVTPTSVGADGTVYANSDGNLAPSVNTERVTDGNTYQFRGWVDEEGAEYDSPNTYVTAMGGISANTQLAAVWNAEVKNAEGFENAITNIQVVRDVEVTDDIALASSVVEDWPDLPAERVLNLGGHTISYASSDAISENPALVLNSGWNIKNGTINSTNQACLEIGGTAVLEDINCTAQDFSYVVGFSNVSSDSGNRIVSGIFETTLEDGYALWTINAEGTGAAEDITNLFSDAYVSSTDTKTDGANTYLSASKLIVSQTPITYIGNGADVDIGSYAYGESISASTQTVSNQEYMGDIIITGVSVDNPVFVVTGNDTPKKLAGQSTDTYSYAVSVAENTDVGNYTGTVSVSYTRMDGSTGEYAQKLAVTITPKQLTITKPSVIKEKVYDGTAVAQVNAGTLEGVVSGDAVSVLAVGAYDSPDAGSGKQISVSYTLTGADKNNYLAPVDETILNGVINRAEGTASVAVADYFVGQQPQPVIASQTNGTTAVTYYYKSQDATEDSYTTEEPHEEGNYTVKAVFAATQNYNAVEAVADFTVSYIPTPEYPYTLFGRRGNDNWYTSEVVIYPPEGYLISTGWDGTYESYCTLTSSATPIIYLKNEVGAVTRPIQMEQIRIDTNLPLITGVSDGVTYYGDSLHVVISDDNLKRVTLNGANVLFLGTTAELLLLPSLQEYVLEAEDAAGNTVVYTFQIDATWMSIGSDGTRSMTTGREYRLGSGLWMVRGDATVYNGGNRFFVTGDGEYEFLQQQ